MHKYIINISIEFNIIITIIFKNAFFDLFNNL